MPKSHSYHVQTWDSNPGPGVAVRTGGQDFAEVFAPAGTQMQSPGAAASHRGERVWEEPLADLAKPRALSGHSSQEAVSLCHLHERLRESTLHLPPGLAWRPVQVGRWLSETVGVSEDGLGGKGSEDKSEVRCSHPV